jgi:hypothetical protein
MGGIFISYRREDSGPYAGRLRDTLILHFGAEQVFRDTDSINPGQRFPRVIEQAVGSCDALVALIGPTWLTEIRRRQDDPNDYVRLEIATALDRPDVLVIPVTVDRTPMPKPADLPKPVAALAGCNARSLTDEDWDSQVARLTTALETVVKPRAWWRRQRQQVKVALIAGVVVVLAAAVVVTGLLLRPAPAHAPPPSPGSAPPATTFAAPAPALNPAGSTDPRAQIVQLTGSWSDQGFVDAIVNRDTRIVALYLQSGMKATTLHQGASAILFGFQGVSQNGDPVDLVKTFQAGGFKVDDELEDSFLMKKLEDMFPLMFNSPLAPKGYTGGYMGGKFVGSLLFWIVQRASGWGPTDQDIQVIKYLIDQGADCKIPLAFFNVNSNTLGGTSPYQKLLPMMQNCAK